MLDIKTPSLHAATAPQGRRAFLANLAEGASDLATVLDIAMGNYRDGFTPAELAALASTTYRVASEVRDVSDHAAAVMALLDRDATAETGRARR